MNNKNNTWKENQENLKKGHEAGKPGQKKAGQTDFGRESEMGRGSEKRGEKAGRSEWEDQPKNCKK